MPFAVRSIAQATLEGKGVRRNRKLTKPSIFVRPEHPSLYEHKQIASDQLLPMRDRHRIGAVLGAKLQVDIA